MASLVTNQRTTLKLQSLMSYDITSKCRFTQVFFSQVPLWYFMFEIFFGLGIGSARRFLEGIQLQFGPVGQGASGLWRRSGHAQRNGPVSLSCGYLRRVPYPIAVLEV
jgi:hypothetical protein